MYSGETASGERRTFGTSGLLFRSNKLMYDRSSFTLWSNITGEPVFGRLARSPIQLRILPMTLTTWERWRKAHPATTVLVLPRNYGDRWNFRYLPGAADRARAGVSFPVWLKSEALDGKEEVYGLRVGEWAKAYLIPRLLEERVVNDRLGEVELVVVADPESEAVRVFRRNGHTFQPGDHTGEVRDESGRRWRVTEEALVLEESRGEAPAALERIPGHVSFWFAWYGFFPRTELYGSPSPES